MALQYSIDVWLQQRNPPDNSTSPRTPTQHGVVYVVHDDNTGHVVLPHMTGNGQVKETFIPQIVLSCFVFWLCGFLFGLIAFILARKSMSILLLSACCTQKAVGVLGRANGANIGTSPQFLPRDTSAERGDATVSRLSVCPSVRPSVRP